MELNKDIEVIAVEATVRSRVLLALKGTDINSDMAVCIPVVLEYGVAITISLSMQLIAKATTFNAYDFVAEEDKENIMLFFKRYLNEENTERINNLFSAHA